MGCQNGAYALFGVSLTHVKQKKNSGLQVSNGPMLTFGFVLYEQVSTGQYFDNGIISSLLYSKVVGEVAHTHYPEALQLELRMVTSPFTYFTPYLRQETRGDHTSNVSGLFQSTLCLFLLLMLLFYFLPG